jgi:hypothetical protein
MMLNPKINLNKPGVKRLNQIGDFAVIANRQLYDTGKSRRFAVVNTYKKWVDSTHENYGEALAYTQKLL